MEKIEYIRILGTESDSALLIFRVLSDCNLSEIMLVFENSEAVPLPDIKVAKGDFVWITNMDREEVERITSDNSSKTNTLILRIVNKKFNLQNFKKVEEIH